MILDCAISSRLRVLADPSPAAEADKMSKTVFFADSNAHHSLAAGSLHNYFGPPRIGPGYGHS